MNIKKYLNLIKFSHTIFAMPFAWVGFFIGWEEQQKHLPFMAGKDIIILFIWVIACMITARTSAMAFNRWADIYWDKLNERTKQREIPHGVITPKSALILVIISAILFVFFAWLINPLCFYLSPVALIIILGYSYTKRFTSLCHFGIGLSLSLAPLGAYIAITGSFAWLPILFAVIVLCWVTGFDIIYSLQDIDFDTSQQLHSIPVRVGLKKALWISRLLHVICMIIVVIAGFYGHFHWLYWIGSFIFTILLIYQQSLVKTNQLQVVNPQYMTFNGIVSIVLSICIVFDIILF